MSSGSEPPIVEDLTDQKIMEMEEPADVGDYSDAPEIETEEEIYNYGGETDENTDEESDEVEITIDMSKIKGESENATPVVQKATVVLATPKPTATNSNAFVMQPSDLDDVNLINTYSTFNADTDKDEKPWKKAGSDIADYFNYGFNEDTWRIYCEKQRRLRVEAAAVTKKTIENGVNGENTETAHIRMNETSLPFIPQNIPQLNLGFQLPPGMNLNLPPELANSIANIAASSLGLSHDFISNLPPMQGLIPSNFQPQSLFPPQTSYGFASNFVVEGDEEIIKTVEKEVEVPDDGTVEKQDRRRKERNRLPREGDRDRERDKERVRRTREPSRENHRKRDRRSRSRDKPHRVFFFSFKNRR